MEMGAFIQSDRKQLLGAKVAKHALETRGGLMKKGIPVTIMLVEDIPVFTRYAGMAYKRGEETRIHDEKDLQFFTLSRFMPPELMRYSGRALVIDPDIFSLKDITDLFSMDLKGNSLAACKKKDAWDSSVMVLDCSTLTDWNIEKLLEGLKNETEDYRDWMQLRRESKVLELPRLWNSLDVVNEETKMLHTTQRLTQPWKTGLPIDFTPGTPPKLFGIIPRKPLLKLRGKWPTHYKPHPDASIETLFFDLAREAFEGGAVTKEDVQSGIDAKNLRNDFFELLATP